MTLRIVGRGHVAKLELPVIFLGIRRQVLVKVGMCDILVEDQLSAMDSFGRGNQTAVQSARKSVCY